jgi:peroxiredoxin
MLSILSHSIFVRSKAMLRSSLLWFLLLTSVSLYAEEVQTLPIGSSAPDFELPGVDYKTYRLADFARAKVLVVVFTCNHCPTAQAYEQRIIDLDRDYRDRGVAFVAISPNDPLAVRLDELGYTDVGDSLADMKLRAKDAGFEFPYLYDGETQSVARAYGAKVTPHVFIFDQKRQLCYNGRIDDSDIKEVTSHDARNAIDALLAGRDVAVKETRVFGCSTKWADKRSGSAQSLAKWNAEPVTLEAIDQAGLEKLAKNGTDKFRLINVWATWCGPCLHELPQLVEIHRMYRKRHFELVTLSMDELDQSDEALKVLRAEHASTSNFISKIENRDVLAETLDSKWSGPLPYTILIAPGGEVVYRVEGPIDPLELKREIVKHIGRTYASKKP